jgi:ADP-ribosyl-[dinitrogen reductase] hydrolase
MRSNHILDGVMGLCVGDALGVPVEFRSREELIKNPVNDMIGYGTHYQPSGTWSDDSSLTFCLIESLCNGYNLEDISLKFQNWLYEGYWTPHGKVFDVGISTQHAIRRLRDNGGLLSGGNTERDNGNGSLMRILPISFITYDLSLLAMREIVTQVSSLTHRHKKSIISCISYVLIANELIKGKTKSEAFQLMKKNLLFLFNDKDSKELLGSQRILSDSFLSLNVNEIKSTGYVIDTLEASLWCFLNGKSYDESVLMAVNLGDDTDTVAAITGGLAGIYYGIKNIPKKWVDAIVRKDDIVNLSERMKESILKGTFKNLGQIILEGQE